MRKKLTNEQKFKFREFHQKWKESKEGQEYFNKLKQIELEKEEKYNKFPKLCKECFSIIPYSKKYNKFCNHVCSAKYTNNKRIENGWKLSENSKNKISLSCIETAKLYPKIDPKELEKICMFCKQIFKIKSTYDKNRRKFCSRNCANEGMDRSKNGGYRNRGGRSKSGWYKGYFCGSSYELAWIIYNIDHNIKFSRNTDGFAYTFEGKLYNYYPDFILEDKSYIEIKGYDTPRTRAKILQFPHPIKLLFEEDLKDIFDYIKLKYGNNFIELYEGNPYNKRNNSCKLCGKPAKKIFCSRSCAGKHNSLKYL